MCINTIIGELFHLNFYYDIIFKIIKRIKCVYWFQTLLKTAFKGEITLIVWLKKYCKYIFFVMQHINENSNAVFFSYICQHILDLTFNVSFSKILSFNFRSGRTFKISEISYSQYLNTTLVILCSKIIFLKIKKKIGKEDKNF